VPAQQRLRPYDLQSVQHPGSQAIKPDKQQPVDAAEDHSLRGFAPQHVELMAKDKVFGLQCGPRSEQPDQGAPDQSAKIAHRSDYQPIQERQSAVWVCGRDKRSCRGHHSRLRLTHCGIAHSPCQRPSRSSVVSKSYNKLWPRRCRGFSLNLPLSTTAFFGCGGRRRRFSICVDVTLRL
jgi:hypothetical protein